MPATWYSCSERTPRSRRAARRGPGPRRAQRRRSSRSSPGAGWPPCGCGRRRCGRRAARRVDDEADLAAAIRSTAVSPVAVLHLGEHLIDRRAEAREVVGGPCGGAIPSPSARIRWATTRPAGLSGSASERKTVPGRAGSCRRTARPCRTPCRTSRRSPSPHRSSASPGRARGRPRGSGERQHRLLDGDVAADRRRSSPRRAVRRASRRASPGSPPWRAGHRSPSPRTGPSGWPAGSPRSRRPSCRRPRTGR